MTEAPVFEPQRLEQFGRLLVERRRKRIHTADIWRAFASAFPHRPQGPSERRMLITALDVLEAQGLLQLPSQNSRRWDRTNHPPVPAFIELVRRPPPKAPDEWRRFPWHSALQWILERKRLSPEQVLFLKRVHHGLVQGDFREQAPLKYRSLQLTGNEKRLVNIARGTLFGKGRLTFDLLGCLPEILPLVCEIVGDKDSMLIFENAGPFTVASQMLRGMSDPPYGAVAYGSGRSVLAAMGYIRSFKRPIRRIDYVGDLDATGLEIALTARARAVALGLPPFRPATPFHATMLSCAKAFGARQGWPAKERKRRSRGIEELVLAVDPIVSPSVLEVLRLGNRVPEEVLGPKEMRGVLVAQAERR